MFASGKFAMKDIEAGKYRLNVNRNGYVSTSYGARAPGRPGTTLALVRGQNLKDIVFRLSPHAVITGRILDEDGEPLPGGISRRHRRWEGRHRAGSDGAGVSVESRCAPA